MATTPDATSTGSTEIAQPKIAQQDTISKPGFPTHAQYKHIETVYLNSITPQRKEKSLITQNTFDRIWDVLQNNDESLEDGQFKFWVRRNFALGTFNKPTIDPGILTRVAPDTQSVLLHDGLLVALQEQLYDLLCYAHGITNHGGRDKTLSALRKYYTWVPKELVAQFTISCPTCMMKKTGLSKKRLTTKDGVHHSNKFHVPALRNFLSNVAAQEGYDLQNDWLLTGGPADDHEVASMPAVDHPLNLRSTNSTFGNGSPSALPSGPQSLPMSREVSLYHGLPNGWQFRTDYATAHAEFMKRKNEGTLNPPDAQLGKKRPRIPSVAPLIGPDYVPHHDNISDEDLCSGALPAMIRHPTCNGDSAEPGSLSLSFESFRSQLQKSFPIDPVLLAMASPLDNSSNNPSSTSASQLQHEEHDSDDKPLLSPKCSRAAAPPALDLTSLGSVETIEAFLAHRNARNMSPYSPHPSLDSPASSVGSSCSSEFPMMMTSCSSAATSALPTPVDDVKSASLDEEDVSMDKLGKELTDVTQGMGLTSSLSGVSIRAVCHEVV
jgi:hypothetical protein